MIVDADNPSAFGPRRAASASLKSPVEMPFRYDNQHLFVDVDIEGRIYNFLFDTGFDFTAIDLSLADKIEYEEILKYKVSGSSFKKHKIQFIALEKVSLSGIDFKEIGASFDDLSFINKDYACAERRVDGVIGANLLRHANWQIDYEKRVIRFSDKTSNFNFSENVIKIPMNSKGWGSPSVKLIINGVEKSFKVDTGSSGSITTGIEFKKELSKNPKKVACTSVLRGKAQLYENYFASVEQMRAGDLMLNDQMISLEKGVSSLLGNQLFEHFMVTVDWVNNQLLLDPIKKLESSSLFDFDLLLKPNYITNKIEISGLYNRDLMESGFTIGQEILTINGNDVTLFSKEELCEYWNQEREAISMQDKLTIETINGTKVLLKKDWLVP